MPYKVHYHYFDSDGALHDMVIKKNDLQELIKEMKTHLQRVELYEINDTSSNLADYDFEQHGEEFVCAYLKSTKF